MVLTLDDVRFGLAKVHDDDFDEDWMAVCAAAMVNPDALTITDDSLDRLLDEVARGDALSRILALSWKIRRTAAEQLVKIRP